MPKPDVDGTLTEPGSSFIDCTNKRKRVFYGESCVDVNCNILINAFGG